jgi:putative membrane protein
VLPLYALVLVALLVSGIRPYDRATWLMEVAPIFIAFPVMWVTRHRFRLTTLLYALIAVHALILIVGGHWTYARVPAGFWVQEWLGLGRNPYDKLGHLAQGFVPAMVAREIFVRLRIVQGRRWLAFVCVCVVLAVSATYELVEWAAALALGQGAEEFLGTQGDVWDTQSDMFMALLGAIAALATLSRAHDRQLSEVAHVGAKGAVEAREART